jgi:hypothetical protein
LNIGKLIWGEGRGVEKIEKLQETASDGAIFNINGDGM